MMSISPEFENEPKTRLALLGTLGHLNTEPLRYDLACLRSLVEALEPDLLGVEVEPEAWERGDLRGAPVEVRDGLVPAARRTDTVIVPLGGPSPVELAPPERGELARLRANLMQGADRLLTELQRVSEGLRHFPANLLYGVIATLTERETRHTEHAYTDHLVQQVLEVVRRDPGCTALVAVNVRHCRHIRHTLEKYPQVRIVRYSQLKGKL